MINIFALILLLLTTSSSLCSCSCDFNHPFYSINCYCKHDSINQCVIDIAFEIKGRLRLIQEFGSYWSTIIGDDCFEVIRDNMTEVSRLIESVELTDFDAPKSIKLMIVL